MQPPPLPKTQKKPKIKIDDKFTFHYPLSPDASPASLKDYSAQIPVLVVSNYPYSFRNYNQYFKIFLDTKKP